jgi:hypothetical protein
MKALFTILLLIASAPADACIADFAQQSVFFKDLPAPLTVSISERASVIARITITEAKMACR